MVVNLKFKCDESVIFIGVCRSCVYLDCLKILGIEWCCYVVEMVKECWFLGW